MKNSGIERTNTKKHIIITAALLVVAVGTVVAVLNKDKLFAAKKDTAETTAVETTDGYTGADFEAETFETDETVGEGVDEELQAQLDAYYKDYYDSVIKPADIEDEGLKALATYYSGYELYDLKATIDIADKYEDIVYSSLMENLRPSGDVKGFCFFSNDSEIFWTREVFKTNEEDLKTFMNGIVSDDMIYEGDGLADDCFTKETTSDGKIAYTWKVESEGGTCYMDYEITFDPATQVVNVYAELGGGVG